MGRRNDHTREQIKHMALTEARILLEEHGMRGLTARAIARRIGYTVGTLYVVFENLDDLIDELNIGTLEILQAEMSAIAARAEPERAVLDLALAYHRFAVAKPHQWSVLFEHVLPESGEKRERHVAALGRLFAIIERALAGIANETHGDAVRGAARALWGGVHGLVLLSVSGVLAVVGEQHAERSIEQLVGRFIAGWRQGSG